MAIELIIMSLLLSPELIKAPRVDDDPVFQGASCPYNHHQDLQDRQRPSGECIWRRDHRLFMFSLEELHGCRPHCPGLIDSLMVVPRGLCSSAPLLIYIEHRLRGLVNRQTHTVGFYSPRGVLFRDTNSVDGGAFCVSACS